MKDYRNLLAAIVLGQAAGLVLSICMEIDDAVLLTSLNLFITAFVGWCILDTIHSKDGNQ